MRMFCGSAFKTGDKWGAWFRVFGYGLVISNMEPVFSERKGLTPCLRVFGVKIKPLTP